MFVCHVNDRFGRAARLSQRQGVFLLDETMIATIVDGNCRRPQTHPLLMATSLGRCCRSRAKMCEKRMIMLCLSDFQGLGNPGKPTRENEPRRGSRLYLAGESRRHSQEARRGDRLVSKGLGHVRGDEARCLKWRNVHVDGAEGVPQVEAT